MSAPSVAIYFVLDGKDYGFRRWSFVPAVGDEVKLETGIFIVKRRCWVPGDHPREECAQAVNIDIEEIK